MLNFWSWIWWAPTNKHQKTILLCIMFESHIVYQRLELKLFCLCLSYIMYFTISKRKIFIPNYLLATSVLQFVFNWLCCRSTVTYIEQNLSDESKILWKKRGQVDHIVLLDWNSTLSQVTIATPLRTLKDALFKVCQEQVNLVLVIFF